MRWLELGTLAEIVDRSGIVRKTAGCSIVGRQEFGQRIQRLNEIILANAENQTSWDAIYASSSEFAHNINQVLHLNALDPDWFTPNQIEKLLFSSLDDDGQIQAGWLVRLNSPPPTADEPTGEPQSLAEVIACLGEDLEQAIAAATELPAEIAIGINQAKAELAKTPEEKEQATKAKQLKELKKSLNVMAALREPD
jgi:hypothetical protein